MKKIKSALISVYYKDGLAPIVQLLNQLGVAIYSTGGTFSFIEREGIEVKAVESLTAYPEILGGRVKTLHPKIFGGILARRSEANDISQLEQFDIPEIDLVIVDLYPFEETVAKTNDGQQIIEKIDIGGVSLIRAAAKNYADVLVVANRTEYSALLQILQDGEGSTDLEQRKSFAAKAFAQTAHYDTQIFKYLNGGTINEFRESYSGGRQLRYGENPHQKGFFFGNLEGLFQILNGKELSYNNLVDVDAAVNLLAEFDEPTFVVIKHTNACGVASRASLLEAWKDALKADPISAFGGVLACNRTLDIATAQAVNELFFEILIAPEYDADALELLKGKKNRIIIKQRQALKQTALFRSLLNGVIMQDADSKTETIDDLKPVTERQATAQQVDDLLFANKIVKHLKSNTIVLVKDGQMLGMGCGQTSRVDALEQAIAKAHKFGFDTQGAVMASDAFFPFPDCVQIAAKSGIVAVIQPGGSIKDQDSIDACNELGLAMVMTGIRHFKH
ncbi:MAG: bifunctional phosphoribosylaminoimidazolecarboxamide formyltransferase/IMP cyclohydrolase [Chitinophagales bacterium]|nr:bifunctional phosphoribosylaminoimidazolecarboxamide formyltransferase/IMP cyclohydrolase [Chitinophagales bacterium]